MGGRMAEAMRGRAGRRGAMRGRSEGVRGRGRRRRRDRWIVPGAFGGPRGGRGKQFALQYMVSWREKSCKTFTVLSVPARSQ